MPLMDIPSFDLPFLEILPDLLYMGVFMLLLLTALCGPVMAVLAETVFVSRKKPFFDKFGLQSAQISFWTAFPIYLFLLAYLQYSVQSTPPGTPPLEGLQTMLPGMAAPFLWAALFLVYRFTWEMLKRHRGIHLFLGYFSALLCLVTFYLLTQVIICSMQPALMELLWNKPLPTPEVLSSSALLYLSREFAASASAWAFFLYLLGTGFAAAASLLLPWLLFQRKNADYGRDYYSFALRHAGLWAAAAQTAAFLAGGILLLLLWESPLHSLAQPEEPLAVALACGLPVCCIALWGVMAASKTPLRHKPGIIVACFLFFTAMCAQFLTFLSALPVL